MPILGYDTLTRACQRAKNRPPNTIALILGLEGARYYVFFSQPDLGQLMNRVATQKVSLNMEIEHLGRNLGNNQVLLPSAVRAARGQAIPQDHDQRRIRAAQLGNNHLLPEAQARGVEQMPGHAEMFLIDGWQNCVQDFMAHRRHAPRHAEIFLTHSPCRNSDRNPSPEMFVGATKYPTSCRAKLYAFFRINGSVRWKIWYALRFGTAEALTDAELREDFPGIAIERMPPHLLAMF